MDLLTGQILMVARGLGLCYVLSIHSPEPISHRAWWGGWWGQGLGVWLLDCIYLLLLSPALQTLACCLHPAPGTSGPPPLSPLRPEPWSSLQLPSLEHT